MDKNPRLYPKYNILRNEYHVLFYCSEILRNPEHNFTCSLHENWRTGNVFKLFKAWIFPSEESYDFSRVCLCVCAFSWNWLIRFSDFFCMKLGIDSGTCVREPNFLWKLIFEKMAKSSPNDQKWPKTDYFDFSKTMSRYFWLKTAFNEITIYLFIYFLIFLWSK